MTLKQQYPASDGWLTTRLTLNRRAKFTEAQAREYITAFGGKNTEIGHVDVNRNPVVIIYRGIKAPTEVEASQPSPRP